MKTKATKTETDRASLFEEMLMWTSYRYCIGRHTYVATMAYEIAEHYYDRLSDERKEFAARDINSEINQKLGWLPVKFEVHRVYNDDSNCGLDALLRFIDEHNITSIDEFVKYSKIIYHSNDGTFEFNKCEPTIDSYFSVDDIGDLIPWMELANCFDVRTHKIITLTDGTKHEVFRGWAENLIESESDPGYYRFAGFGWRPIWLTVDGFKQGGFKFIPVGDKNITCVEDAVPSR